MGGWVLFTRRVEKSGRVSHNSLYLICVFSELRNCRLPEVDEYLRPIEQVDAQIKSIVDKYKKSVAAAEAARAKAENAMVTDDTRTAPAEQTADSETAPPPVHRSLPPRLGTTDTPTDNRPAVVPTLDTTSSAHLIADQLPRIPAVESKELVCYISTVLLSCSNP